MSEIAKGNIKAIETMTELETHHELVDVLLGIRDRSPEAYNSVKRAIRQWSDAVAEVDALGESDDN